MNNQELQNIDNKDFSDSFIFSCQQLCEAVENDDAVEAMAWAKILQSSFDRILQSSDPLAPYQVRSSLTEIHRLLRILNRDLLFWQGAKQARAGRGTQVLATLQSIAGFYQLLVSATSKELPEQPPLFKSQLEKN